MPSEADSLLYQEGTRLDTIGSPQATFAWSIPTGLVQSLCGRLTFPWESKLRPRWCLALLGQLISFLLAAAAASQATLALHCHLSAPFFTVSLVYMGLSFFLLSHYMGQVKRQKNQHFAAKDDLIEQSSDAGEVIWDTSKVDEDYCCYNSFCGVSLKGPLLLYMFVGLMDVYANYLTVLAYKYTSITSVTLLTAFSIPSTMILSHAFLGRRHSLGHFAGIALCLFGIAFNVMLDCGNDGSLGDNAAKAYPHMFIGDCLAILGGFIDGTNIFVAEVVVQRLGGPNEYLGMLGCIAMSICIVHALAFEREEVYALFTIESCYGVTNWLLVFAFVACTILAYIGGAQLLHSSEATFYNLSLQTGGFWSAMLSVVAIHVTPHPLFFLALLTTVSGVSLFQISSSNPALPIFHGEADACVRQTSAPVSCQI